MQIRTLKSETLIQFIRYALVGIIGTGVQTVILILLVEYCSLNPTISTFVGFVASLIVSFILNSKWTFNNISNSKRSIFVKYIFVSCSGLILSLLIMHVSVNVLHLWYIWAQVINIIVVPISNFYCNKFWSFK